MLDPQTRKRLVHHHRDLEALGDYLLAHYAKVAAAAGMTDQVLVGELPFRWQTDFHFSWSGGWKLNQEGETYERDLVIVIPGKNRRRAVIMADHYDTAYMEDVYGYFDKGGGPRIAAAGADDNHSATAAMMLAAPIFLDLAKQGKLEIGHLARASHRRGVPFRLHGRPGLVPAGGRRQPQDPPRRRPLEEPGQDPRGRRVRDGHDRPQQRPREGRFPDRPRRESRVDAVGRGGPRGHGDLERLDGRPGTAGPSAAAPRAASDRPTAARFPTWPCTCP